MDEMDYSSMDPFRNEGDYSLKNNSDISLEQKNEKLEKENKNLKEHNKNLKEHIS
jgi:cell division protein FtsB